MPDTTSLTIASRFKGPPDSGNGGYVCGAFAVAAQTELRIRLLAPPPLDTPLTLEHSATDGLWRLWHGEQAVASGTPAEPLELEVPLRAAVRAGGLGFTALRGIPRALVSRLLRVRPAPSPGRRHADFSGPARLRHGRRAVDSGGRSRRRRRQGGRRVPLGCARLPRLFRRDRRHAPDDAARRDAGARRPARARRRGLHGAGLAARSEGRKHRCGTAIFDEDGELCARALATWIPARARHAAVDVASDVATEVRLSEQSIRSSLCLKLGEADRALRKTRWIDCLAAARRGDQRRASSAVSRPAAVSRTPGIQSVRNASQRIPTATPRPRRWSGRGAGRSRAFRGATPA